MSIAIGTVILGPGANSKYFNKMASPTLNCNFPKRRPMLLISNQNHLISRILKSSEVIFLHLPISWTLTKRQGCHLVAFSLFITSESIRIKSLWIWIIFGIVMYCMNWNNDCGSPFDSNIRSRNDIVIFGLS